MTRRIVSVVIAAVALACSHSPKAATTPAPAATPAATPAAAPAARPAAGARLPAGVTAAMVAEGDSIFNKGTCQRCHGIGGHGGPNGPDLTRGQFDHTTGSVDDIVRLIRAGVPLSEIKNPAHKLQMNPLGGLRGVSDVQLRSVAAYVYSISHR